MARILVIDDDELLRRFVVALLERRDYSVQSTDSGETARTTENTVTAILNPVIGLTSARLWQLTQMLREFGNVKANTM